LARIAGVDLPKNKRIEIALTYIYGIGRSLSQEILKATGVDFDTRCDNLTEAEVSKIREFIDKNVKVEGDLRRDISMSIKRLMDLGCYRGLRHRKGLPAAVSGPRPMRAPGKGRLVRSLARRNKIL